MFRFSIRDVLWLTAICGILAGWAVDHIEQMSAQEDFFRRYVTAVEPLGYEVERGPNGTTTVKVPPYRMVEEAISR